MRQAWVEKSRRLLEKHFSPPSNDIDGFTKARRDCGWINPAVCKCVGQMGFKSYGCRSNRCLSKTKLWRNPPCEGNLIKGIARRCIAALPQSDLP
jgi:hypothetical protein